MENGRQSSINNMVKALQKFNERYVNDEYLPLSIKLQVQLIIQDTYKTNEVDETQIEMLVNSFKELTAEYNLPIWVTLDINLLCDKLHNFNKDINPVAV